jgi:hypothetical protein
LAIQIIYHEIRRYGHGYCSIDAVEMGIVRMFKIRVRGKFYLSCWIATAFLATACQGNSTVDSSHGDSIGQLNGFLAKNGNVIRVEDVPITVQMGSDVPSLIKDACGQAAETLNKAAGRDLLKLSSNGSASRFSILWGVSRSSQPDHQASTELTIEKNTIVGAEIGFDTAHFTYSNLPDPTNVDAESVCLHELGHMLGFAHSTSTKSFMYPVLQNGQVRRQLSEADLRNFGQIY